ncbi:MAG: hypothetical protein ACKVQC_04330 [Elusimicrobiota bacterium]
MSYMKFVFFSLSLFLIKSASACAVCFGGDNSNMTRGFFWGVVVLLALLFSLILGLTTWIIRASKRKSNEDNQSLA